MAASRKGVFDFVPEERIVNVHAGREYTLEYPEDIDPFKEPEYFNSSPVIVTLPGIKLPSIDRWTDSQLLYRLAAFFRGSIPTDYLDLDLVGRADGGYAQRFYLLSPLSYPHQKFDYAPISHVKTISGGNTLARRIIDCYNAVFETVDQFYKSISEQTDTKGHEAQLKQLGSQLCSQMPPDTNKPVLNLEQSLTYRPPRQEEKHPILDLFKGLLG